MPHINLLPWREEVRKERQRQFVSIAAGVMILAALMVYLAHAQVEGMKDYQQARNKFVKDQIAAVEKEIKEIEELAKVRSNLLNRMKAIEQLQSSRPQVVHLFEELAKTIPEGVYLKNMSHQSDSVRIEGSAQSNARVSVYMRQLDDSEWLKDPKLLVIQTAGQNLTRSFDFNLTVSLDSPDSEVAGK